MITTETLRALAPLAKQHGGWPWPNDLFDDMEFAAELARVLGCVSLNLTWTDETIYRKAASLNVPVVLSYSPFRQRKPDDSPNKPHTWLRNEAYVRGSRVAAEYERLRSKCDDTWLGGAAPVRIEFDAETFLDLPDVNRSEDIAHKYNECVMIVREYWPDIQIGWYSKGAIWPTKNDSGWDKATYVPDGVISDANAVPLYRPQYPEWMDESYRRTCNAWDYYPSGPVTPWLCFGCGYVRDFATDVELGQLSFTNDYPLEHSWLLGRAINGGSWYSDRADRFAPWDRAEHVVIWAMLDARISGRGSDHLEAYLKGANNIAMEASK